MYGKDIKRSQAHHQLLKSYIEEIGRHDTPAPEAETAVFMESVRRPSRFVGRVSGRKGAWDLYLVQIDTEGPLRLEKRRLRRYRSRRMAEIMAKYLAAVACDQQATASETDPSPGII